MKVYVYKDEYYPYYGLTDSVDIEDLELTQTERDDYDRVQNEWKAWQKKLGEAFEKA